MYRLVTCPTILNSLKILSIEIFFILHVHIEKGYHVKSYANKLIDITEINDVE